MAPGGVALAAPRAELLVYPIMRTERVLKPPSTSRKKTSMRSTSPTWSTPTSWPTWCAPGCGSASSRCSTIP
ncbi:hypothetical protein LP420_03880 [Massilia sp. B-10]|nr:hypothetical protein LP420_03880 [Massilia sp. B-10]